MTDFDAVKLTIAVTPSTMVGMDRHIHRVEIMERHDEDADEVTVLVPPGTGAEARRIIWEALGSKPYVPENVGPHGAQDGDYIRRAYGSL